MRKAFYLTVINDYEKVLRDDPNNADAYEYIALSYWGLGNKDMARASFIIAAELGNQKAKEIVIAQGWEY